jgi:hypothetical protein
MMPPKNVARMGDKAEPPGFQFLPAALLFEQALNTRPVKSNSQSA